MTRETKFPWWGWIGGVCLLPVLYVVSIFPVGWIVQQFDLGEPQWFISFYWPLIWAVDEWEWFGKPVEWIAKQIGLQ